MMLPCAVFDHTTLHHHQLPACLLDSCCQPHDSSINHLPAGGDWVAALDKALPPRKKRPHVEILREQQKAADAAAYKQQQQQQRADGQEQQHKEAAGGEQHQGQEGSAKDGSPGLAEQQAGEEQQGQ